MTRIATLLAVGLLSVSASAQTFIDTFSGTLAPYTATRILKATPAANDNVGSFEISGGAVRYNTTTYFAIEQYALTRTDFTLPVGYELRANFSASYTGTQDIGLYVGAGTPTSGIRADYVNIYRRNNGQLFSRGFNGTTELALSGGSSPTLTSLFIARTSASVFELGFYDGATRTVVTTRTMTSTSIGNAIGLYADVRAAGLVGNLDNLQVIPEPSTYAALAGLAGLALVAIRRRRS